MPSKSPSSYHVASDCVAYESPKPISCTKYHLISESSTYHVASNHVASKFPKPISLTKHHVISESPTYHAISKSPIPLCPTPHVTFPAANVSPLPVSPLPLLPPMTVIDKYNISPADSIAFRRELFSEQIKVVQSLNNANQHYVHIPRATNEKSGLTLMNKKGFVDEIIKPFRGNTRGQEDFNVGAEWLAPYVANNIRKNSQKQLQRLT
eukprot:6792911-Ditylum_brightwellii.AAC.1